MGSGNDYSHNDFCLKNKMKNWFITLLNLTIASCIYLVPVFWGITTNRNDFALIWLFIMWGGALVIYEELDKSTKK